MKVRASLKKRKNSFLYLYNSIWQSARAVFHTAFADTGIFQQNRKKADKSEPGI